MWFNSRCCSDYIGFDSRRSIKVGEIRYSDKSKEQISEVTDDIESVDKPHTSPTSVTQEIGNNKSDTMK